MCDGEREREIVKKMYEMRRKIENERMKERERHTRRMYRRLLKRL